MAAGDTTVGSRPILFVPGRSRVAVYRKDKFHAKAYITHARLEVVGSPRW